jgi:hypothetical protein
MGILNLITEIGRDDFDDDEDFNDLEREEFLTAIWIWTSEMAFVPP